MKIIVLNTSTKVSGAERSLMDVLSVMPSSVLPFVVLPDKGDLFQRLQHKVSVFTIGITRVKKRIGVLRSIRYLILSLKHTYKMYSIIKAHNINLIYSNSTSSQIYAILLKLATGRKIVWHVRDNLPGKLISIPFSWFSDKIICISRHIFDQMPFKNKAELVYNGIDTNLWRSNQIFSNKVKDELGIDKSTILVGHIGQLIPWKRHDLFIDVAKQIIQQHNGNVHFVIIGDDLFNDFPDCQKNLHLAIEQSDLNGRVSFLGYKENLIEYLNGIDILLHMADNEPFGRIIIEAMALEKPVIARDQGGPREIISDNRSGFLVNSSNAASVADKLKVLIDDATLRNKFGKEGRRIIETNFSIKNLEKVGSIISLME